PRTTPQTKRTTTVKIKSGHLLLFMLFDRLTVGPISTILRPPRLRGWMGPSRDAPCRKPTMRRKEGHLRPAKGARRTAPTNRDGLSESPAGQGARGHRPQRWPSSSPRGPSRRRSTRLALRFGARG